MKQDSTARRVRHGYTILAALLLAGVVVFNADRLADLPRGYLNVVALVEGTGGVRAGSPVYVEGVEAGRVLSIQFVDLGGRGAVALDIRLEDRVRDVVRRSSLAYTARDRFVGEPIVRISAGGPEMPPIQPGDTLHPADRPTPQELLSRSRAMPAALDSLAASLREIQGLARARRPELAGLTEQLAAASAEAGTLRRQLEAGHAARWLDDPELPLRIRRLQEHAEGLSRAADDLGRYGADRELGRRAADVGRRAERLRAALDTLERTLAEGDGILIRARQDTALAVAIGRVRAQIDSLRAEGVGFALRTILP